MKLRENIELIASVGILFCLVIRPSMGAVDCTVEKGGEIGVAQERAGPCNFDVEKRSFQGSPAQQAACLTRHVKLKGRIGDETITSFLKSLVGTPAPAVQPLLDALQISQNEVGGNTNQSISANYFVIHDTSWPNCSTFNLPTSCDVRDQFPVNRDDASWSFNRNFGGHPKPAPDRLAHVITSRVGTSITEVNFSEHIATTKFEQCRDQNAKTKLFIGVENIQPRVNMSGENSGAFLAPNPGFTTAQYERLALLYVVASSRRGQWLVPAFHAVIDDYYLQGHDDPQNFDMEAFSAAIKIHFDALEMLKNGR